MKFAILALVATVAAAGDVTPPTSPADPSDWSVCKTGADCKGASYICCTVTKNNDGSDASPGNKICTDLGQSGTVPSTVTTAYKGMQYFCSKTDHTDPTNTNGSTIGSATTGSASLAVSATTAAIAAFILA
tara:strand:+ start:60 stop:452 length:393 start_codon:yes stop_codon:yes gene_type:complete